MKTKNILIGLSCLGFLIACSPPLNRARQALDKGDYAQAEILLTHILDDPEAPTDAKPLLSRARFYTQGFKVALAELQEQNKTYQDDPTYLKVVQEINAALEKLDQQAINGTEESLLGVLKETHDPFIQTRLQWLLYSKSKTKNLELLQTLSQSDTSLFQELSLSEKTHQEPERYYELLEKFPQSSLRPLWYQNLILILEKKEALGEIHNVLIQWKKETPEQSQTRAEILLKQAKYSLETQSSTALSYYLTYLRLFPKHPAGRSTIYTVRDEFSERLNEQDHLFLADAAYQRYMYQTAYSELEKVPARNAEQVYRLGEYALKAKYYREARSHFQAVHNQYRSSKEAGLASVKLAQLQRDNKAYAEAQKALTDIKKAYASQKEVVAAALWEQGVIYDFQNLLADRARVCLQLVTLAPDHEYAMPALWHGIWFAYQNKEYSTVIDLLEKYKKYYQSHELSSRFKYWLARAYEETEEQDKSRQIYQHLIQNPLLDYYTHRAKERLRVLQYGGADQYATGTYTGYQIPKRSGYASAFQKALKGDSQSFSSLNELYYLGQMQEFMPLAKYAEEVEYQVLHGIESQKQGHNYEAVTRYRYLAETDDRYLPAAFPLAYFAQIEKEAKKYVLNPFLISGLIWQESQYKADIQSWVGATGLMQIMPATAEHIASKLDISDFELTQASDNIRMGTWYLHDRHTLFDNNSMLAVASYNAGAAPVYRWLKDFGHLDYDALAESISYPETRNYVKHVFTSYWIYQHLYGKS